MGKYYIDDVKCGLEKGGMACGPGFGTVVASVKVSDGSKSFWLTNAEVEGLPGFYMSDEDIYDRLINISADDDFIDYLDHCFIDSFEGIKLREYDEMMESIKKNEGNPAVSLIRYIVLLTRCEMEEVDKVVALVKGKFVDEVEIPASDVEK
ncbi:hypothetical protein [Butyrivibrio fibrisolvens]|uniref:hypothetical protein n=1 Tax=Butyrivibrio fibrisolvens TaxID=831 RepID=UPI0003B52B1E|nr:hypothetical protein [Butyrivibrio fibrisolvens]